MCVCSCVCKCTCTCVHVSGGHPPLPFFFLESESFTEPGLELTDFVRPASQRALGLHPFPSPQWFVDQTIPPPSPIAFPWVLGITLSSLSHVCRKHLYPRSHLFSLDVRMWVIQRFLRLCGQDILGCLLNQVLGNFAPDVIFHFSETIVHGPSDRSSQSRQQNQIQTCL